MHPRGLIRDLASIVGAGDRRDGWYGISVSSGPSDKVKGWSLPREYTG